MLIILVKFLLPAFLLIYFLFRFLDKNDRKSKSILVLFLTSLLFNMALAQNYNYNLMPLPERDGFAVFNSLPNMFLAKIILDTGTLNYLRLDMRFQSTLR